MLVAQRFVGVLPEATRQLGRADEIGERDRDRLRPYLDSSCLLKAFFPEPETGATVALIPANPTSSSLRWHDSPLLSTDAF